MRESLTPSEDGQPRRAFEAAAGVLLDAIDTIALVLDPAGRIVLANRACEAVLGLPAAEMLGRTPLELGFAPREACPDEAAGDVQVQTPAGEVRLIAWSSRVLFEPDGSVRCVVATGSDVTDARATERRLRESERRFRELAENVNDLVAEITLDAEFAYVNPRFEAVLGWAPDACIGHSIYEYVHPADHDRVRQAMTEFDRPGVSRQTTLRVQQLAGGYRPLESVARTFIAPDGQLRLAVILRDVSERAAAETELRRIDRLATLGTFAAGVAHEINNPVAAILLAAEVSLERPRPESDSVEVRTLQRIADHARRCGAIVRSMLDFAAQGRRERRLHDVSDLVARAVALVDGYARERGATVKLHGERDLPRIRANGVEIEQVFVNLLRNALESRSSGVSIEIRVAALAGRVRVMVCDDGDGVPADARAQIFEPFYSTKRSKGGTGLGLAIARRIAVDHGGEIRIEDPPGSGTCFAVELPIARANSWRTS
ncbi:MAG: PAS domain S-box protein [Myxococcota bacterium]